MTGERRDGEADPARLERRATTCAGCGRSIHDLGTLYAIHSVVGCERCMRQARLAIAGRVRLVPRQKRAAEAA